MAEGVVAAMIGQSGIVAISMLAMLSLSGCGKSAFETRIAEACSSSAGEGADCACIARTLDMGLPDHLKLAFDALRWPLKPDPKDREAVNGAMLRSAGVDPADRQAVESIRQEFKEKMHSLNEQTRTQCGGRL
jgi:hypothetical protein